MSFDGVGIRKTASTLLRRGGREDRLAWPAGRASFTAKANVASIAGNRTVKCGPRREISGGKPVALPEHPVSARW